MTRLDAQNSLGDAELVQACCDGRAEAFGPLVERYQDRVYNAVRRIAAHDEDARDIVQEAFLKAFENLAQFRGASSFYTWLFRIAVNLALSARRHQQRQREVKLPTGDTLDADSTAPLGGTQAAGLADPPEAGMVSRETQEMIGAALAGLDPEQRAAIVLRDIEGLDYQEIAEVLELPAGTVKSRIHRARMALRDRLRERVQ